MPLGADAMLAPYGTGGAGPETGGGGRLPARECEIARSGARGAGARGRRRARPGVGCRVTPQLRRRDWLGAAAAGLTAASCTRRPGPPAQVSIVRAASYTVDLTEKVRGIL